MKTTPDWSMCPLVQLESAIRHRW